VWHLHPGCRAGTSALQPEGRWVMHWAHLQAENSTSGSQGLLLICLVSTYLRHFRCASHRCYLKLDDHTSPTRDYARRPPQSMAGRKKEGHHWRSSPGVFVEARTFSALLSNHNTRVARMVIGRTSGLTNSLSTAGFVNGSRAAGDDFVVTAGWADAGISTWAT
jgi:hypothetical protein